MKQTKNTPFQPRLTVVGAGPGDPELITLKALRALECADVVLYDALVTPRLLEHAPARALKIYVGKREAEKSMEQDQLNTAIVEYASKFGHVVRLKGGDPFVFGRGMEEILFAQSKGISAAYIPGISSSIAVAGSAGIAVTQRGVSRSFWVITATTDLGTLNPDLQLAVHTDATLVVLMGLSKLPEIATEFIKVGKSHLPVAVIQDGTLPTQKVVVGTASDIAAKTKLAGLKSPAILVFGEVVHQGLLQNVDPEILALLQAA